MGARKKDYGVNLRDPTPSVEDPCWESRSWPVARLIREKGPMSISDIKKAGRWGLQLPNLLAWLEEKGIISYDLDTKLWGACYADEATDRATREPAIRA